MALPKTRTSVAYFDGLKVAFAKSNTFDWNTNNQAQVGVEGYIGHSEGAHITKLEFDEIVPTSRLQSNVIKKYLVPGKSAVMTYLAGSDTYSVEGVFVQCTFTGESMNGTLMCKTTFEGGKPRVLGKVLRLVPKTTMPANAGIFVAGRVNRTPIFELQRRGTTVVRYQLSVPFVRLTIRLLPVWF